MVVVILSQPRSAGTKRGGAGYERNQIVHKLEGYIPKSANRLEKEVEKLAAATA
jgi:hypothetical protein